MQLGRAYEAAKDFGAARTNYFATALAFGYWMTESGIPNQLVSFVVGHGFATWQFLLIINGILLLLDCFLEVTATLLLVLPILAPALQPLGVDPVHFSIIFTHNMEIGLVHPPVGLNLFVLSTISSAPIGEVIRGILPFLILLLMVLGIITYVPILTLWLPNARCLDDIPGVALLGQVW
jgi:C4-dicarboxylate transporter DctM subunit